MIAAGLFANYASSPRLAPTVQLHPSIPPLHLQRQSTVSPPGQLEYYVAWGVTKVHLKEKGLAAVSSKKSRRKRHIFVRNVDDKLAAYGGCWDFIQLFGS
jgi:hypothetical protein